MIRKGKPMGEIAIAAATVNAIGLVLPLVLIVVLVFVWLLSRRIRRWFGRSLKAKQDLARAAADVAERLERVEDKLDNQSQQE